MNTIAQWIPPVTDRTAHDVNMVSRLNQIDYTNLANLPEDVAAYWVRDGKIIDGKGALNLSDLRRVTSNIVALFVSLDIVPATYFTPQATTYPGSDVYPGLMEVGDVAGITDILDIPELPTVSWWNTLEALLDELYLTQLIHTTTPEVPDRPYNTFQKWNDIESILADIHARQSVEAVKYAGSEYYAGQDIGLLL